MMKIGIVGLGRMGGQIALKLHEGGHKVVVHNRSEGLIDEMKKKGLIPAYTKEAMCAAFVEEQVILWLMIPADAVDEELDKWLAIVPKGSILIDGGNSDFRNTRKRSVRVREAGSVLLDIGTSGGVWGYANGFSMMVGGDNKTYNTLKPILDTLALPGGAHHCFGESGAGHYVKMVHNAIEYGMMQSLAEGYSMLKEGPYPDIELAEAGDVWQHRSVVTSWLNELTRDALRANPTLEGIEGYVAESGEARWALEVAREYQIATPAIAAAFDVRLASQKGEVSFATKLLAAMRNAFGGHQINK